jgi:drug/metabolite transporter (DMT)-like permease
MKWILVAILVCATTVGDVFRSLGMRQHGEIYDFRPGAIGSALRMVASNFYVIVSTCAMAVSFFSFMKLVSIAPMSFAVPMSAAAFVPETLFARRRWMGVALILAGVVFITQ